MDGASSKVRLTRLPGGSADEATMPSPSTLRGNLPVPRPSAGFAFVPDAVETAIALAEATLQPHSAVLVECPNGVLAAKTEDVIRAITCLVFSCADAIPTRARPATIVVHARHLDEAFLLEVSIRLDPRDAPLAAMVESRLFEDAQGVTMVRACMDKVGGKAWDPIGLSATVAFRCAGR